MIVPDDAPLFVSQSPADFRKSYDGLSGLVINSLRRNPTDGSLYAFFNRSRTQVKVLYYRSGGMCLWQMRLEAGTFAELRESGGYVLLSRTQFQMLIEGISLEQRRQRIRYKNAA